MKRVLLLIACIAVLNWTGVAQEATPSTTQPPSTAKGTTLVGCLQGPDADNFYTLTSMQHRAGVEVVGCDDLKKGAGARVKLTGSWEPLPGSEVKKGDSSRRFKATEVAVLEEKCQAPAAVTPLSKKKQQQKARAQQK